MPWKGNPHTRGSVPACPDAVQDAKSLPERARRPTRQVPHANPCAASLRFVQRQATLSGGKKLPAASVASAKRQAGMKAAGAGETGRQADGNAPFVPTTRKVPAILKARPAKTAASAGWNVHGDTTALFLIWNGLPFFSVKPYDAKPAPVSPVFLKMRQLFSTLSAWSS